MITVLALAAALVAVTVMAETVPEPDEHVDLGSRHPGFTGACRYAEALNLGGTIYLADPGAHQPRFLHDAVAGDSHSTVAARRPDSDACEGDLLDGASTYPEPGATLHPVDDWSPGFRLVSVQPNGRMVLYQAAWSTTARWAGDYLDLRKRGAAVTAWSDGDCPANADCDMPLSPPLPRNRADALIESVLVSRIDPTAIDHSYPDVAHRHRARRRCVHRAGVRSAVPGRQSVWGSGPRRPWMTAGQAGGRGRREREPTRGFPATNPRSRSQ